MTNVGTTFWVNCPVYACFDSRVVPDMTVCCMWHVQSADI
jgi:hypothetical protein